MRRARGNARFAGTGIGYALDVTSRPCFPPTATSQEVDDCYTYPHASVTADKLR